MLSSCQPLFFSDVCKRYGSVFCDLPEKVTQELFSFVEWAQNSGCWSLLKENSLSPRIHERFYTLFVQHTSCDPVTLKVLCVLSAHKRLGLLPDFLRYLRYLKEPHKTVYLRTSKRLLQKSVAQLTRRLKEWWNMPVEIHQCEDPRLLLGGVFLWDHFMIDASLKTMLTHLRNKKNDVFSPS